MAFSTQRAVSNGTLQLLALTIDFFDKSEITAYVSDIPEPFTWATDTSIRFNRVIPAGLEVLVRRTTDLSQVRHIFSLGAQFKDRTLDEDFRQILHISQEAVEGSNVGDLYAPLNMHGNPIKNLGPATADGDAVSLGQVKTESASAWVAAGQAQAAAAGAAADAAAAKAAKDRAVQAETNASTSATAAAASATTAQQAVASIGNSVQVAQGHATAAASSAQAAAGSATTAATEAGKSKTSADASAQSASDARASLAAVGNAALQLGMIMFGHRAQPFAGFATDDGQELSRALYPDFAAALDTGKLPVTTEAEWQADQAKRGSFVAVSSPGKFRMRDTNGMSPGSWGAPFLRGSGAAGGGIVRDSMQDFNITMLGSNPGASGVIATRSNPGYDGTGATYANLFQKVAGGAGTPRFGAETAPVHVRGAWMTRLFGVITPLGSAEANSLATSYAALSGRVSALETNTPRKYQGYYGVVAGGQTFRVQHNLGRIPYSYQFEATLGSAYGGWPAGSVLPFTNNLNLAVGQGYQVSVADANASNITMNQNGNIGPFLGPAGVGFLMPWNVATISVQVLA